MKRVIAIVAALIVVVASVALLWSQVLQRKEPALKSTKVCQLTGAGDRGSPGKLTGAEMTGVTGGVTGTDLGFPFEYNHRLYFLFGDSRETPPDLCEPEWCGAEDNPVSVIQPDPEKVKRWRFLQEWTDFSQLRGDGRDSMATAPLDSDPEQCISITFETTQVGLVFAHEISENGIGIPAWLNSGQKVAANPQDRWVLSMGSRILVITQDGKVFAHEVAGNSVGDAYQMTSAQPVAANPQDKWVLVMEDRILVITRDGKVFAHQVTGNNISNAIQLSSNQLIAARPQDKWVLTMGKRILVITEDGRVFGHDIAGDQISDAFQLSYLQKVAANPQDKWVLTMGTRILVITEDGRIFAHPVIGTDVRAAIQLDGPRVATSPRDKWVLAMGPRILVLTGRDGWFRGTQLLGRTPPSHETYLGRDEGAASAFVGPGGTDIYAFFILKNTPPGCNDPNGCPHNLAAPGGKSVLGVSTDGGVSFQEIMPMSSVKFLWTAPVVDQASNIPGLQGDLQGPVVWVWGTGREGNDGNNPVPWGHSYPFLAVASLSSVGEKSGWRYFEGLDGNNQPAWREEEAYAQPVTPFGSSKRGKGYHECLGYFSVRFLDSWNRWVMLYTCNNDPNAGYNPTNGPRGVYLRTADAPWGPWSNPRLIFDPGTDGYCYFMHNQRFEECINKGTNPAEEAVRDITNWVKGMPTRRAWAGEYLPLLLPSRYATANAGKVTLYYVLSTWNPYQVVLMKTQVDKQ